MRKKRRGSRLERTDSVRGGGGAAIEPPTPSRSSPAPLLPRGRLRTLCLAVVSLRTQSCCCTSDGCVKAMRASTTALSSLSSTNDAPGRLRVRRAGVGGWGREDAGARACVCRWVAGWRVRVRVRTTAHRGDCAASAWVGGVGLRVCVVRVGGCKQLCPHGPEPALTTARPPPLTACHGPR